MSQAALGSVIAVVVTGGRNPKRAVVYGAVLATLPDLDVLQRYDNDVEAMIGHRTWSHSLLVHLLAGPVLGLLLARFYRTWRPLRWISLVVMVWMTHALLDVFTVYGTWLFWPFQDQPFMRGSIFIIDPAYTVALLVAMIAVWRSTSSAFAVRSAIAGVVVSSAYLGWGMHIQDRVEGLARNSLEKADAEWSRLLATPTPFNSILWRIVAIDGDQYYEGFHSLLDDDRPIRFDRYQRNPALAAEIAPLARIDALRNFNHDYMTLYRKGSDIVASDLRMGLEPYYFFSFVMADQRGGNIPRAAASSIDVERLFRWLAARFRSADAAPIGASLSPAHLGNAGPLPE